MYAQQVTWLQEKQSKKNVQGNQVYTYYFDVEKCKACALREGCYKAGAKSKTYSVTIKTATQQAQLAFQQTEEFKKLTENATR